ncbi:MAG: flagellar motor protein, partial [Myxococcaceae bacterium]
TVGLRGGWGPRLGPQVWGQADVKSGRDTWYGGYSVDVDAPHLGERRTVTGARTEALDGTAVFVEDVAAHDANALRLSRAVGLSQAVGAGFEVTGRYERGVRMQLDVAPTLSRDAAGLTATWTRARVRAYGRAELRLERGTPELGLAPAPVSRTQRLVSAGGEVEILANLRGSVRANYSDTTNEGALEARLLEGSAGLAWRFESGMVVLRYSIERELQPPSRGGFAEKSLQIVQLMPAVTLGSRFALAAGGSAGWSDAAGNGGLVLSGSLRPSVKVVGGLELAVEVARRSAAPDGGESISDLTALRGEAGYRFNEQMVLALGYTVFGFSGLGLSDGAQDSRDRVYLRAELAY